MATIQIIKEGYCSLGPFGTRGYDSEAERIEAIKEFRSQGYNYFVPYHDTQSRWALMYGTVTEPVPWTRRREYRPNLFKNPGYDLVNC